MFTYWAMIREDQIFYQSTPEYEAMWDAWNNDEPMAQAMWEYEQNAIGAFHGACNNL